MVDREHIYILMYSCSLLYILDASQKEYNQEDMHIIHVKGSWHEKLIL